ncbi:MAG: hypothetical protein ACREQZ_08910, partial [Woeseiaceae bacterium]
MRRLFPACAALTLCLAGTLAPAATLSPALDSRLTEAGDELEIGTAIVAFESDGPLGPAELGVLQAAGVVEGFTLPELNMVAFEATAGQIRRLADAEAVRSIWDNAPLEYHLHEARVVAGVARAETDPQFRVENDGIPLSGSGDFAVVINDSGIDGVHDDLKFPEHVIENVQIVTDTDQVSG